MISAFARLFCLLALAGAPVLFLSGCAMQRAAEASAAQKNLIGKTKEQIFGCMGIPKRRGAEGGTEVWAYHSGNAYAHKSKAGTTFNDLIEGWDGGLSFSDEERTSRFCEISLVFRDSKVAAVRYIGPTGGFLTEDEQCAYAVRSCLPREETP